MRDGSHNSGGSGEAGGSSNWDDSSGSFAPRPFAILQNYAFPDRYGPSRKPALSAEDKALFLREALREPSPPAQGGFLLGEQCDLSKFRVKKKPAPRAPVPPPPETRGAIKPEGEEDIFAQAMRHIQPLPKGKGRQVAAAKKPVSAPAPLPEPDFASQVEFALNYTDEYLEGFVVGLDELILNRLRQGRFSPEAHLDLHGLNAEQAFEALKDFMRQAWFKGLRTVLLVPGRGRNSPAGQGILRQKLPYWLSHEPFKRLVLAFCTAQPHDGGPGSVYALLRKSRKKGPVRWEMGDTDLF